MLFTQLILVASLLTGHRVESPLSVSHGLLDPMMRSLNTTVWGYRILPVSSTNPAPLIERFEVRAGDCSTNNSWNDCQQDRERSELSERHKTTAAGQTRWYHWQFYLPTSYQDIYPTKVTLGQFHQKGAKPAWMFELDDQGYWLVRHLPHQPNYRQLLIPMHQLRGTWQSVTVKATWQRSAKGGLKVWVNQRQKVDYRGETMSATDIYFKYGLYRAFISRYRNKFHRALPTQWVEYANVCSASTTLLNKSCPIN
ncbi:heparin lyase I family protein [Celerinatantimonas yamalensis]|uniref:Heparin lyase I family protein n=1 Tax=Celerinatantimonas yamalensis TaxID=559956 RepID=A0ABW9G4N3_9GAMM